MTSQPIALDPRYAVLWVLLIAAAVFLEAYALGAGLPGDTLSELVVYGLRFDRVGRFVVLGFITWFFYHLGLAPVLVGTTARTWRDAIALGIGLVWAGLEAYARRSS